MKHFATIILLLLVHTGLNGQIIDTTLFVNQILNSVVYLEGRQNDTIAYGGTGFFIGKTNDLDTLKTMIFLVTNKHLISSNNRKYGDSLTLRVYIIKNNKKKLEKITIPVKPYAKYNKNDADIAVVDITNFWLKYNITNSYIDYKYFATDELLKKWEFNVGDELNILGFPSLIYDLKNTTPILRRGVISTNLFNGFYFSKEYQKAGFPRYLEGYMLDASIFPGSSGSLVYYYPQKLPLPKGMKVPNLGITDKNFRKRPIIMGIVSSSIITEDSKDNTSIDIGIVYSYRAIKETIDLFK